MRRILPAVFACFLASPAMADFTLTILHTNDFHARFEPITKYDSTCGADDNAEGKCFGGSARLATAIAEARKGAVNPVLFDGGDQFQGTLFYTRYKGKLTAEMMNRLGYDAMTVGNHEFDDGPEVLRAFAEAVNFPVLMSNADISREPSLKGKILKSSVIERGGEKIGLIGLTPQNTAELASPGDGVFFTAPADAVQAQVDTLTDQDVNKIIVLSHSGYGVDMAVARDTTGVDVIVGGHSNTYLANGDDKASGPYPTMVGNTAIVQAYAYGKFLGKLEVVFDDTGAIVSATGGPQVMDASVTEDQGVKARIVEAAIPLNEIRNRVIGQAKTAINASSAACRSGECQMGVLVADAMLERVRGQGVEIAITNGGGLRAGIDAGSVTMGEVLTVLPFQNTLSTFELTGSDVLAALEHGVSRLGEGAGSFPQVAGMRFAIDVTGPAGNRIRDVMIGDTPLDTDRVYYAVTNNFLRNGGDGYTMFRDAQNAYDFGPDIADVVAEYLIANGAYTAFTDGRIRLATQ